MIQGVGKVVVPVTDQERATRFWTERVGFAVAVDEPYGDGERWIELAPPDGGVLLVLSPRRPGERLPEVPEALPHSPVFFTCDDLRRTYQELSGRGVSFPTPPTEKYTDRPKAFTEPSNGVSDHRSPMCRCTPVLRYCTRPRAGISSDSSNVRCP